MLISSDSLIPNPLVSVVICSFNRANTISQAIDSVLNQVCDFPFEIIIGDDGSTDNSRPLLLEYQKQYPEKMVLLFQDVNLGLGANWASCVQLTRSKHIAPIDDDDYWCDNLKLQKQVDFLEKNPEYGLVHTNYFNFYDDSDRKTLANPEIALNPDNLMQLIFSGKYSINPGTVCFRKDLLSDYLDDYIHNSFPIQDWPTWLILSKYSKFMYLDTPTLMYRKIVGNMSNPDSYEKIVRKYTKEKLMYKYLCDKFPEDLHYNETEYDVYVNGILLGLAYKKWDYKSAHKYGSEMMKSGAKSLKVRCTQNWIMFNAFYLLQKLKSLITNR